MLALAMQGRLALMVVRSFRCLKPLLSASYSSNPLADVWRAILELDTMRFTALEKPDCVKIYQGQIFQIQDYLPSSSLGAEQCFQLGRMLRVHSTSQLEDHLPVR